MKKYRIALMPGDGIGPEICETTKQVTEEVVHHFAPESLEWVHLPIGWEAIQQKKPPLPLETLDELEACDGWVLGPHDSASYPEQVTRRMSCSRYPPAPGKPSGSIIIGSIETTIPGSRIVSMSSRNSNPASLP